MPGYVVHDRTTALAAAAAGLAIDLVSHSTVDAAILAGSTFVSGIWLSPDLDVFINPSWKYVLSPYGGLFQRWRKRAAGLGQVARFGAVSGSRPLHRWGPLRILWTPYRLALFAWWIAFSPKRGPGANSNYGHRSVLSHTPVLADLLRLAYLAGMASLAGGIILGLAHRGSVVGVWQTIFSGAQHHQLAAVLLLAGCSLATTLHAVLDRFIPD